MNRFILAFSVVVTAAGTALAAADSWHFDRSRLPAPLQNAPLERMSSGGLLRLDNGGDLVGPPRTTVMAEQTSSGTNAAAAGAPLDGRVGPNVRLGDDPAALQDAQCANCNPRAQAEPQIMRSRTDLDFAVAAFQEGRFTNGGALDCGYATTHDGGLTWSRALLPGVTQLVGGPYFRATDPVVGIDLNNFAYVNVDAATDPKFDHGDILVSRSTDGGATFAPPVIVYHPTNTNYFTDKNWMAVNTFSGAPTAGRVLVTWTLFTNFPSASSPTPLFAYYSDDQGQTWSPSNGFGYITPANSHMQGSQPIFLHDGTVALVYWRFFDPANNPDVGQLEVIRSADGGATFDPTPTVIAANVTGYSESNRIRSGSFLPSATGDRTTSNLYVVYQTRVGGNPKIVFTKSTDVGNTWSAPIPISDNPAGSGVFNAAITASPDGQTLTAAFYDHRDNPNSTTLVDIYEAQSFDGGATWQPNIRLTSVSTDASLAPLTASGYMLGDYLGIAEPTNVHVPAMPVFVDTRTGNPDPFIARIGVAPQFDFTSWQAARLSLAQINSPQYGLHQLNIATRLRVETGDNAMIAGFILTGSENKKVVIRGIGPSLSAYGISATLQDPTLELHYANNAAPVVFNDNWSDGQPAEVQAAGLAPSDSRESAIAATLPPGSYTAILRGKSDSTGVGLVEVYDVAPAANSQLGNLSTRGSVQAGNNVMIGGFIVGGGTGPNGTGSEKVVVRALGPSLASSGVTNPLLDPVLELHDSNGTGIFTNDNWRDSQATELTTSGLAPKDDRESALIVTIPPGTYTAIARGKNDTTGVGLVEVYNVQ